MVRFQLLFTLKPHHSFVYALYMRDGGTLPDQISGLTVRAPGSYPHSVARSDVPELARKLEGRTAAAEQTNYPNT
jgi:hypothetical protein